MTKFKVRTSMKGMLKYIQLHPRKNYSRFFNFGNKPMSDMQVRMIVKYAVDKGYEYDEDIPEEEVEMVMKKANEI